MGGAIAAASQLTVAGSLQNGGSLPLPPLPRFCRSNGDCALWHRANRQRRAPEPRLYFLLEITKSTVGTMSRKSHRYKIHWGFDILILLV